MSVVNDADGVEYEVDDGHEGGDSQDKHGHSGDDSDSPSGVLVWPGTAELRMTAQSLDDAIQERIRTTNRLGHEEMSIDADVSKTMLASVEGHENTMRTLLREVYEQRVPGFIRIWAQEVPGLSTGALFPRIVGIIGNPQTAIPYKWSDDGTMIVPDGPPRLRTVRQLWQWGGAGDPFHRPYSDALGHPVTQADKLRAGKRTQLRPLLYAWSSSLQRSATPVTKEGSAKFGTPMSQAAADSKYWAIFKHAREQGQGKLHKQFCKNRKRAPGSNGCGTVAHPEWGEEGSPWRPGHVQAHAHRLTQKELLRDYWRVAGGMEPMAWPRDEEYFAWVRERFDSKVKP
jgi:hypothetical protein